MANIHEDAIASIAEIMAFWTSVMRNETFKVTERIKASELLMEDQGTVMLPTQAIQSQNNPFDGLTTKELEKVLARMELLDAEDIDSAFEDAVENDDDDENEEDDDVY